jgi:hypothetical protein
MKPVKWSYWNRMMGKLPTFTDGHHIVTKWKASLGERLAILFTGTVWVWMEDTMGGKLNPMALVGTKRGRVNIRNIPAHAGVLNTDTSGERLTITKLDGSQVRVGTAAVKTDILAIGKDALVPGMTFTLEGTDLILGRDGLLHPLVRGNRK